jgi:flagellar biosynthesis/type III secretory pathway chaperone
MQTLDPKQFESALTQLFTHQLGLLDDLVQKIAGERAALSERLSEKIFLLAEEKQSLMLALDTCLKQGQTILTHLRNAMPERSTAELMAWCDPSGDLDQLRVNVMDKTDHCLSQNRHNGIQIQRQQQTTRKALKVLRGEPTTSAAYTARGQMGETPTSRRLGKA